MQLDQAPADRERDAEPAVRAIGRMAADRRQIEHVRANRARCPRRYRSRAPLRCALALTDTPMRPAVGMYFTAFAINV